MSNTVEFGQVERSIRDLTRIEKLTPENARVFVSKFAKKYSIPRGNESKLLGYCLDEIKKMNSDKG